MKTVKRQSGLASRIFLAGAIVISTALPVAVLGQRGRPSGGDGGSRGGDSSPRRESSPPPQRSERSDRGSEPSRRESPPPRREESPPPRREESPRPNYDPPARRGSDDPPRRREESSPRREESSPRREESSPRRNEDNSPRRESGPERRPSEPDRSSERTSDPSPQRDSAAPRRDSDRGGEIGRTRTPESTRDGRRDRNDNDSNDPFTRRRPSGSSDRPDYRDTFEPGRTRTPDTRSGDTLRYRSDRQYNRGHDVFTRSTEGRRYSSGIVLREGGAISNPRIRYFFPHGYSYYPYYCPTFDVSLVFWSPYSYYYRTCPPYIYRHRCLYRPPSYIYIEVPVYVGNDCRGYDSDLNDYYLNRSQYDLDERDRDLRQAIDALREAFRYASIEPLVEITDPQVKMSIFRKGRYEYSIDANDFLDMTRDAMRATDTISFDLYRFKKRAAGVVVVSGKHVYRNGDGERRTVYVSYVLERLYGKWILTQVGTAPDRIEEPR